ncbi:phosphoribosyl transferase [Candidatus Saccharibacteria bacterium]|nr:phosphoribosyl transferase [Candidatus Saccharibacteria bacterium]
MRFIDRIDAGRQLAKKLAKYRGQAVVYALPRGGVVVGTEVAKELEVPLDLILVRKIGHPSHAEYAICAVAESAEPVCNEAERQSVDEDWFKTILREAHAENERRRQEYFPENYQAPAVADKTAILIDDGIATGLTMEAAVEAVQVRNPKKIIVAVPVAPFDSIDNLSTMVDEVVVLDNPENFMGAVGAHYDNFPQVEDDEVIELLSEVRDEQAGVV